LSQRIEKTDALNETPVALGAAVSHREVIERRFLGAMTR
jgi:hypothetical protein